jgi:hypothetical protein
MGRRYPLACRAGAESEGKDLVPGGSKGWTTADDEILRKLVMDNYSPVDIAIELKRSVPAVKSRARRLGIPLGSYSPR